MSVLMALFLMAAPTPVAGVYVAQQRETASALELEADGRYRWFYSQGALDLSSEGQWTREGDAVILTSDPVTPPSFVYAGSSATGQAGLLVRVLTAADHPIPAVDVVLRYRSGKDVAGSTDGDGQKRFDLPAGADALQHIVLALPVFELRSQDFKVEPKPGETLTFRLEANDLGKQAFARERLKETKTGLAMSYRGAKLDYQRQEGEMEEVP
jgi:hypothetical protein